MRRQITVATILFDVLLGIVSLIASFATMTAADIVGILFEFTRESQFTEPFIERIVIPALDAIVQTIASIWPDPASGRSFCPANIPPFARIREWRIVLRFFKLALLRDQVYAQASKRETRSWISTENS